MDTTSFAHNGSYLMLALDHRGSFRELMNPSQPDSVSDQDVTELKADILTALSEEYSGVLLDPITGLPAYKSSQPYLLSIEKTGYQELNGGRITELEYSVEELKEKGAHGVKLLIYYDHDSVTSLQQMETAHAVVNDCKKHNLPLFLEIVTYNDRGLKHQQILSGISLFLDQGIRPDVFKLEYPGAPEHCQKITQILGTIPWILLTRGVEFDTFKENLRLAVAHGAKGFLAGRSVWQEAAGMSSQERKEFLRTVAHSRFSEICKIVSNV